MTWGYWPPNEQDPIGLINKQTRRRYERGQAPKRRATQGTNKEEPMQNADNPTLTQLQVEGISA
jgi:hypothetical protein